MGFNIANYQQVGRRKRKKKKWGKGGKNNECVKEIRNFGVNTNQNKKNGVKEVNEQPTR